MGSSIGNRLSRQGGDSPAPSFDLSVTENLFGPGLIDSAYDVFRHLTIPEGVLFLRRSELKQERVPSRLAELPGALLGFVRQMVSSVEQLAPPGIIGKRGGFEVWLGKTTARNPGAFLHVDNDEQLRRETGRLVHPRLGAILHLGPRRLSGGETVFETGDCCSRDSPELFRWHDWPELAGAMDRPRIIPQRPGRLILFRGELPHAVAPLAAPSKDPRVTLLANYWARLPGGAHRAALGGSKLMSLIVPA